MTAQGEREHVGNAAERAVWDLLVKQRGDDWVVLSNIRLTNAKKDYELDFVVLMPDVGVVVLEVKGGSVWVDEQGRWRQGNRSHNVIRPVQQAMEGKYALREYVERDPRWKDSSRNRIRWGNALVVPHTRLAADFETPDCPRWMISGIDDLDDLGRGCAPSLTSWRPATADPTTTTSS